MFITEEDYKVVIGDAALKVISQTDEVNRNNAEAEAQEEISGYLRPRYDCNAIFSAEELIVLRWMAILLDNRAIRLGSPVERRGKEYLLSKDLVDYLHLVEE